MKIYKIICFFLIFPLFCCGCNKEEDCCGPSFYRELITRYVGGALKMEMLQITYTGATPTTILQTGFVVGVDESQMYSSFCFPEKYKMLAERNGDTSFNREVFPWERLGEAFADNFCELHIVSNADWDEEHPAGTPLDDILLAHFDSYAKIIHDGYKINGAKLDLSRNDNFTICKKMVSELTSDDMEMLCYGYDYYDKDTRNPMIVFTCAPTLEKEHTLTLRWTTVEGTVKTASVTCTPQVDPALL